MVGRPSEVAVEDGVGICGRRAEPGVEEPAQRRGRGCGVEAGAVGATAASAAPRGHRRSTDKIALSQGSRASAGEAAGAVIAVLAVGLATASRVVAAGDGGAREFPSGAGV